MRRMLTIFGISLLAGIVALILMLAIPIKDSAKAPCCDDFDLEASYGFPLRFRQVYSGGFGGQGKVVTRPGNVVVDGAIVFVATAAVISVASAIRKRSKSSGQLG